MEAKKIYREWEPIHQSTGLMLSLMGMYIKYSGTRASSSPAPDLSFQGHQNRRKQIAHYFPRLSMCLCVHLSPIKPTNRSWKGHVRRDQTYLGLTHGSDIYNLNDNGQSYFITLNISCSIRIVWNNNLPNKNVAKSKWNNGKFLIGFSHMVNAL